MNLNQAISLIHTQATMKLKSQANALVLSYLWWVLEPLLFVALFYFVFKYVLYRGGDDFFIFLMVGKIPFLWFSKAVSSGANSIIQNKGLLAQRVIPKIIFPLVNCQEAFYKQLFAFAILLIFLVFNGFANLLNWWQLVPLILLQYILIIGVASFFSVFVTFATDFTVIISMFMMGLMFTSGIFWDVNLIQDQSLKELLLILNPLAALIDGYRQVLMYGNDLTVKYMLSVLVWGVVSFFIGAYSLSKYSNSLTRRLFS
ncbi:ABC transporter permease [Colwellia sp. RSH04]|uniref:ABC transporter permease n=1 Tax=Colwellia sp. RSH04 TaxID=2305464 RepID=UPI000E59524E|nr:ABC transporter permease [Colwellia sp. RSH04]RHW74880.1 ABC transporter [Colwellia sp. RSH04]